MQKPNAGGGALTIFKRGRAPKSVEQAMKKGSTPEDEEKAGVDGDGKLADFESSGSDTEVTAKGVAKNESIFTYQNVNYTIPTANGERKLLNDVQGYVRPGKLTALSKSTSAKFNHVIRSNIAFSMFPNFASRTRSH